MSLPAAPVRPGADRDGHAVHRRRERRPRRRRAGWPTTSSTTATTASWSAARPARRPTTSVAEDGEILRAVIDAVGDRCTVVAGVGTNHTAHSVELARQAEKAGADGVLLVSPYYNKPTQAGIAAHFEAVAAASDLRIMLYDIPGRTGVTHRPGDLRAGRGRTRSSSRSRTPSATCYRGVADHAGDRAELLQRRRRAQPRLADPRRRRRGLGGRPRRRASSTPTWSPGSTPATSTAP